MEYLTKDELRRLLSVAAKHSELHRLMFAASFRHGTKGFCEAA